MQPTTHTFLAVRQALAEKNKERVCCQNDYFIAKKTEAVILLIKLKT